MFSFSSWEEKYNCFFKEFNLLKPFNSFHLEIKEIFNKTNKKKSKKFIVLTFSFSLKFKLKLNCILYYVHIDFDTL